MHGHAAAVVAVPVQDRIVRPAALLRHGTEPPLRRVRLRLLEGGAFVGGASQVVRREEHIVRRGYNPGGGGGGSGGGGPGDGVRIDGGVLAAEQFVFRELPRSLSELGI
jgi:hypothetical protein